MFVILAHVPAFLYESDGAREVLVPHPEKIPLGECEDEGQHL